MPRRLAGPITASHKNSYVCLFSFFVVKINLLASHPYAWRADFVLVKPIRITHIHTSASNTQSKVFSDRVLESCS